MSGDFDPRFRRPSPGLELCIGISARGGERMLATAAQRARGLGHVALDGMMRFEVTAAILLAALRRAAKDYPVRSPRQRGTGNELEAAGESS